MTFTPIPVNSLDWDVPSNAAWSSLHAAGAVPDDHSLLAWAYDPRGAANSTALTVGTVYMVKVQVTETGQTSSGMVLHVPAAGVTLTAGQNFVGLYDAAGTRVAVSADQTVAWGTNGFKTIAWTAPVPVTPGFYYLAILTNGATGISIAREANLDATLVNINLTSATLRWSAGGTGLTGLTTLPASVTMADRAASMLTVWAGLDG